MLRILAGSGLALPFWIKFFSVNISWDLSCAQGFWVILTLLSVPSTCEVARVPLCHSWPPTTTANLWPTYSGQEHLVSAGSDADTLPRSGTCGGPVNWSPPIADSSLFRAFKRLSTISWSGTTEVVEEWGAEQDLGYQLDSFSACERC